MLNHQKELEKFLVLPTEMGKVGRDAAKKFLPQHHPLYLVTPNARAVTTLGGIYFIILFEGNDKN